MTELGSWQTRSSEKVFETPFLEIFSDDVVLPNGQNGHYGWLKAKAESVSVVPVTDNEEILLVRQRRYTIGNRATVECVAGGVNIGETHLEAAHRELLEETGHSATSLTPVIEGDPLLFSSLSKANEPYKLYIATGLHKEVDTLDEVDGIEENIAVPLEKLPDYIFTGNVVCSQSIASLFAAYVKLTRQA